MTIASVLGWLMFLVFSKKGAQNHKKMQKRGPVVEGVGIHGNLSLSIYLSLSLSLSLCLSLLLCFSLSPPTLSTLPFPPRPAVSPSSNVLPLFFPVLSFYSPRFFSHTLLSPGGPQSGFCLLHTIPLINLLLSSQWSPLPILHFCKFSGFSGASFVESFVICVLLPSALSLFPFLLIGNDHPVSTATGHLR